MKEARERLKRWTWQMYSKCTAPQAKQKDKKPLSKGHHCHPLVLFAIVRKYQILELDFDLHPLLIRKRRPDVMWLRDRRFVRLKDHLCPVVVYVQSSKDQNQPGERGV